MVHKRIPQLTMYIPYVQITRFYGSFSEKNTESDPYLVMYPGQSSLGMMSDSVPRREQTEQHEEWATSMTYTYSVLYRAYTWCNGGRNEIGYTVIHAW